MVASCICEPSLLLRMWTVQTGDNIQVSKEHLKITMNLHIHILEHKRSISILFVESKMVTPEVQICQQDCQLKN